MSIPTAPLLRLSRRRLRRHLGRSLVVVGLIALPVAALVTTLSLVDGGQQPGEPDPTIYGRADLVIRSLGQDVPGASDLTTYLASLGPDTRTVTQRFGTFALDRGSDRAAVEGSWSELPFDDPLVDGLVELSDGSWPERPGEAVVTGDSSTEIGTIVEVGVPPMTLEVVGRVDGPQFPANVIAFPGTFPPNDDPVWTTTGLSPPTAQMFVDLGGGDVDATAGASGTTGWYTDVPMTGDRRERPGPDRHDRALAPPVRLVRTPRCVRAGHRVGTPPTRARPARGERRGTGTTPTGRPHRRGGPRLRRVDDRDDRRPRRRVGSRHDPSRDLERPPACVGPADDRGGLRVRVDCRVSRRLCSRSRHLDAHHARTAVRPRPGPSFRPEMVRGRCRRRGVLPRAGAAAGPLVPAHVRAHDRHHVTGGDGCRRARLPLGGIHLRAAAGDRVRGVTLRLAARDLQRFGLRTAAAAAAMSLTFAAAASAAALASIPESDSQPSTHPGADASAGYLQQVDAPGRRIVDGRLVTRSLSDDEIARLRSDVGDLATVEVISAVSDSRVQACSDNGAEIAADLGSSIPAGCVTPTAIHADPAMIDRLPDALAEPLRRGEIVGWMTIDLGDLRVTNPRLITPSGTFPITPIDTSALADLPSDLAASLGSTGALTVNLVPSSSWEQAGLAPLVQQRVVVQRDAPVSAADRRALDTIVQQHRMGGLAATDDTWLGSSAVWGARTTSFWSSNAARTIAAGVGVALIVLLVLGLCLRLVRLESRSDERTLRTHGSTPRQQARLIAWRALFITVLGGFPGVILTTATIALLSSRDRTTIFPGWGWLVALLVGIPAIAYGWFFLTGLRTPTDLETA